MSPAIWLLRHGSTPWAAAGRHTGRTDIPLDDAGLARASALRDRLPQAPGLVLCSPLARARATAERAGLVVDDIDDGLLEWDYGAWEGLTTPQIREQLDDPAWTIWSAPIPSGATPGEQIADVVARATRVIDRCRPHLSAGVGCVLVAHGHLLRILTATWLGLPGVDGRLFALAPATICTLGHEHEQPVITGWNQS